MKKEMLIITSIFLIFISILFVSPIKITEVELNPEGSDSGNEWIEFYSEEVVNSTFKIVNNDADEIFLNLSFSGHFVYVFSSQWLDNSDEKVLIYNNSNLLYETPLLEDSQNTNQTWQLCVVNSQEEWVFEEQTKQQENLCSIENPEEPGNTTNQTEPQNNTSNNETNTLGDSEDFSEDETPENISENQDLNEQADNREHNQNIENTINKINLTQDNKILDEKQNSKDLKNKDYSIYYLLTFCVLLLLLFLLREGAGRKRNKNEFR